MTEATIRLDETAAPGESLPLTADFSMVPDVGTIESVSTPSIVRKKGSGTLTLSTPVVGSGDDAKVVSYNATASADAGRGSIFVITIAANVSGGRVFKVSTRITING